MKLFAGLSLIAGAHAACTGSETFDDSITTCSAGEMKVAIPACAYENARFTTPLSSYVAGEDFGTKIVPSSGAINNCEGVFNAADDTYDFSISTNLDECGSSVTNDGTTMVYKNAAQLTDGVENSFISRIRRVKVDFECSFDLKMTLSAIDVIRPSVSHYEVSLPTEDGDFVVSMGLYTDNTFATVHSGQLLIEVPEPIYVGVELTGTTNFVMSFDNCWATPSSDANDATQYFFIEEQCGDDDEVNTYQTLVIYNNGHTQMASFSMLAFSFNGLNGGGEIYFHCDAIVCDETAETCTKSCPNTRKRRSGDTSTHVTTTVGPIQIMQHDNIIH